MSRAEEGKNFRSHYYEKVGFRGVDEKKTLETIFNENDGGNPVSHEKLTQFALKCSVPAWARIRVWKMILKIEPLYQRNLESVWKRRKSCVDLMNWILRVTEKVKDEDPLANKFTVFHMAHTDQLGFTWKEDMEALHHKNFTAIAESVIKMTDCEVSAYWLAHEIYLSINNSFSEDAMTQTMQFFYKLLSNTSSTVSVYSHLEKLGISDSLPISTWFRRGFAGVLHESALEKIWDKVIGGSVKILAFVAFTLVETSRMALMQCQTSQEVIRCLCSASEETDEMIAQKAIEFWQKDGSHAFPDGVRRSLGSGGGTNKNIPATMVPWEGNLMDVYKAHPAEDQPEVFIPKAKKRFEELKTEKGEKEKRNP